VIQVFYPEIGRQWIVGVVGQLQLEVLISRLEAEYKVEAMLEGSPFDTARWIKGSDALAIKTFADFNKSNLAKDRDGDPVFMARSSWDVNYQQERNPELVFSATKKDKGFTRRHEGHEDVLFSAKPLFQTNHGASRMVCLKRIAFAEALPLRVLRVFV
jgi:hypothetical protein